VIVQQQNEIAQLKAQVMGLTTQVEDLHSAELAREFGFPATFDFNKEGDDWFMDEPEGEPEGEPKGELLELPVEPVDATDEDQEEGGES
jgi:hypothetical protein